MLREIKDNQVVQGDGVIGPAIERGFELVGFKRDARMGERLRPVIELARDREWCLNQAASTAYRRGFWLRQVDRQRQRPACAIRSTLNAGHGSRISRP